MCFCVGSLQKGLNRSFAAWPRSAVGEECCLRVACAGRCSVGAALAALRRGVSAADLPARLTEDSTHLVYTPGQVYTPARLTEDARRSAGLHGSCVDHRRALIVPQRTCCSRVHRPPVLVAPTTLRRTRYYALVAVSSLVIEFSLA